MPLYESMDITIEKFDPAWSRLDQMRWQAGIFAADAGIRIRISDGDDPNLEHQVHFLVEDTN